LTNNHSSSPEAGGWTSTRRAATACSGAT